MGSFVPLTLSDFGRRLCIAGSVIGAICATAGDCRRARQARRPLYRVIGGSADRQGRLGHRHRRRSIHRGRERHDHRPVERVHERAGQWRLPRPRPQRWNRSEHLRFQCHRRPQARGNADRAEQRHGQGSDHHAAHRLQSRAGAADRRASARRHRSHVGAADTGARRPAIRSRPRPAGAPFRCSTAACASICK